MEEKCLKTPVYTMETVFEGSAEVPVDIEFNLPDYCPEISKILKCRATSRIAAKSADSRSITVDGSVAVNVIYADSENTINSYEYQYPFSKTFEAAQDISDARVTAVSKCEYINCRAVTERKIDIHGAVSISIKALCRKSRDIICDIDDATTEVLRSTAPATMPVSGAEKYMILEEEIEIGSSQPDIRCLVRYDAAVSINDCKLLAGKAMVKGETILNLLYRDERGEMQTLQSKLPFSLLLELEGATEECECETGAYIAFLEVKPKFNSSGVSRSFSLDGKIALSAAAYCNNDVQVITDAYSRSYEAQIKSEEVCFNKMLLSINDTFGAKGQIEINEGSISGIYDVWCDIKSEKSDFEGDCLVVSGTVSANIIASDESGAPVFYERTFDYTYRYKMPFESENLRAESQVAVTSVSYTISGDKAVEIKPQMEINARVYECKTLSLLSDISVDESKPLSLNGQGAMTVYFADAGENIWDIARKYLADIKEVKRLNGIENDILPGNTMILLPLS